jgi:putative chitinase
MPNLDSASAVAMPDFGVALRHLWPHGNCKIAGLIEGMTTAAATVFDKHGIATPLLVAHVMAQVSHECGAGTEVVENLNYSATRMMAVWPSRFPSHASAAPYAHNPRALANKVYNGRMGNRIGSDDGWSFRGRACRQAAGAIGCANLFNLGCDRRRRGIDRKIDNAVGQCFCSYFASECAEMIGCVEK